MGFGEKTRAVEIRGTYMRTIANEMHTCGQKGSAGKFIFETNPGRSGLLKVGGCHNLMRPADRGVRSSIRQGFLARWD